MRKIGRLASIACSVLMAAAFVLPGTTAQDPADVGNVLAAEYFLVPVAAAAILALSTAIWGRLEASRTKQPFESILLAPLIIVLGSMAILFVAPELRRVLN